MSDISRAGSDRPATIKFNLVGRQVSALGDLLTILLIYIIAARLYNRRVALLGATFSALAVLQIQQSHFFTVDTFANLFIFLAIYFAVEIFARRDQESSLQLNSESQFSNLKSRIAYYVLRVIKDPLLLLSLGFGVSFGMAAASKLDAAPLAILLPGAFLLRYWIVDRKSVSDDTLNRSPSSEYWTLVAIYLIAGAVASIISFRIFMPYAFHGLGLNPAWVENMKELVGQSGGDVDVPFALQWARRSHLFSFDNLTTWGLGLPLGILAWIGFLVMLWRIIKGELQHLLLWGWTAIFFVWQSMAFNPTMRYQLPIYPLLCMMAGWFVIYLWNQAQKADRRLWKMVYRLSSIAIGAIVLALTLGWAYAFTRIYTRPVTRVAATAWIYQNVPGPINLRITTSAGTVYQQPLPFPSGSLIQAPAPDIFPFTANASGTLTEVYFPHIEALMPSGMQPATAISTSTQTFTSNPVLPGWGPDSNPASAQTFSLDLTLDPNATPDQYLATSSFTSDFSAPASNPRGRDYVLTLNHPLKVFDGQTYFMRLDTTEVVTLVGAAPINESDFDDGLPLRYGNYDGFGGIYQGGLNLQIYWDDNAAKLTRFVDTLT